MENPPFEDVFPTEHGDFPMLVFRGVFGVIKWDPFFGGEIKLDANVAGNFHFEGFPLFIVHCLGWCHIMNL